MDIKNNKVLNIILKVVTGILIAFTVFIMLFTVISVTTLDRNDRNLFGIRFYIVQTDSMSPSENNADLDVHFNAGDIILIKNVKDPTALESGQIIAFISTNKASYGETVTHMIREPRYNSRGALLGYVTFGTNTGADDEALVEPEYVIGEYAGKLPGVGHFFAFVKSTPGYICCILIPFLLLILYNGADVIRLFRKYKKEQTAIIDAEKAEIAAERQRNEDMLRELQALRDKLEGKTPEPTAVAEEQPIESTPAVDEAATEDTPLTAEEIAAQKKAEANRKRKETIARKKAEAEVAKLAEEEAARIAAEEEAKRLADEEAARKKAEAARKRKETIARKKAEEEAQRLAEEAAAQKKAEAARKRRETIARKKAEEEAQRLADEAAAQKKAEAARKRRETIARKKAEEEAQRLAEEAAGNTADETTDGKSDT